jgi:hypothetical protein
MESRLPSQWHKIDLAHAVNLVRVLASLDEHNAAIAKEGEVLGTGQGMRENPRLLIVNRLIGKSLSLTRILRIQGVPMPAAKDLAAQKKEAAQAAETLGKITPSTEAGFDRMSLIGRPRMQ